MGLFRAANMFARLFLAPLLMASTVSIASAAEPPTDEVLQKCRELLSSQRGAILVHWSTRPLPPDYRRAAGIALRDVTIGGWIAHANPNRALTIIIHMIDPETRETAFVVLVKDERGLVLKDDVYAFEFALSSKERSGMTGLFFCNKTGPSAEWVWGGSNWMVAKNSGDGAR